MLTDAQRQAIDSVKARSGALRAELDALDALVSDTEKTGGSERWNLTSAQVQGALTEYAGCRTRIITAANALPTLTP